MIEGAIFDLDGTLLDSMQIWDTLAETYLTSIGITPRAGLSAQLHDLSLSQAYRFLKSKYSLSQSEAEIEAGCNAILNRFYSEEAKLKPGVPEFLRQLSQAGVRMCVATASDKNCAELAMLRGGILPFFRELFTCAEIGHGKNTPDIYEHALKVLRTDRRKTVIFEDSAFAAATAAGAGFPVIGVFDPSEPDPDALRQASVAFLPNFTDAAALQTFWSMASAL